MDLIISRNGEPYTIFDEGPIEQAFPEYNGVVMKHSIEIVSQSGLFRQISLGGSREMCILGFINQGFMVTQNKEQ